MPFKDISNLQLWQPSRAYGSGELKMLKNETFLALIPSDVVFIMLKHVEMITKFETYMQNTMIIRATTLKGLFRSKIHI